MTTEESFKLITENRKARHDYHFESTLEAGLSLLGWEVKSLREGGGNLRDGYIREVKGELFLVGAHIAPYKFGRREEMIETRDRKLLIHKKERERLLIQVARDGITLVPFKLYFKGANIKLEFAVGKGKKLHDKRQDIKSRDAKRDIDRALSQKE